MPLFNSEQLRKKGKQYREENPDFEKGDKGSLFLRKDLEEAEKDEDETKDPNEHRFYTSEEMKGFSPTYNLKKDEEKKNSCEECEETEEPEELSAVDDDIPTKDDDFGFNIADHLDKINDLLGLLQQDIQSPQKEPGSLIEMIHKMLSPKLMGNLPLADVSMSPDDMEDLDGVRGKITMMSGHKHGDEPMHIKKKIIKLIPKKENEEEKVEEIEEPCENCDEEKEIVSNIANNVRNIISDMQKINYKFASVSEKYVNSLKLAYQDLNKIAYNSDNEDLIAKALFHLNPSKYNLDKSTKYIVSSIINDISICPEYSQKSYKLLADRVKIAYHNLLNDPMVKQAFYETKSEDSPSKGFNMCPKYKTVKGSYIPVAFDFCQRECIEGKPEDDGKVTCKYAYWLENVADSHAKVMDKLDIQRNPDDENMYLRLPDGQKEFPQRGYMRNTEKRMEDANIRGRSWDDLKKATKVDSESPGKILNYESLMDEVLKDKDIHRHETGYDESTEKKLRTGGKEEKEKKTVEQRLYNKGEQKRAEKEENNVEFKLLDSRESFEFDKNKLMDELIEQVYPRKDSIRPKGE